MSLLLLVKRMSKAAGVGESRIQRGIRLLMTKTTAPLPASPYVILSMDGIKHTPSRRGSRIANFNFYDPVNQKQVTMAEQRIPKSIHLSSNIGSSRGWMIRMSDEDLSVHLTNMFNPSAPKSTHKVISLPILLPPFYHAPDLSKSMATLQVRNVSLSSSPDNQECILAVKFWGRRVSFCKIAESQWRHSLPLSSRCMDSLVVYSNKDSTFYLTPPTDTFFRKDARNMPEPSFPFLTYYRQLGPLKHPKMGDYEYELLRRCYRTKFLVESPSGDLFIIVKYCLRTCDGKPVFPWEVRAQDLDPWEVKTGTRWFMLYMRDPTTREESYVQDIGDLCIFLGKNEPFCVPASMYPGLIPNSIYFIEFDQVYLYNIADQTFSRLSHDSLVISDFWIQPILHK